jgi:hypothetical protein
MEPKLLRLRIRRYGMRECLELERNGDDEAEEGRTPYYGGSGGDG